MNMDKHLENMMKVIRSQDASLISSKGFFKGHQVVSDGPTRFWNFMTPDPPITMRSMKIMKIYRNA